MISASFSDFMNVVLPKHNLYYTMGSTKRAAVLFTTPFEWVKAVGVEIKPISLTF